jgi:hypothetical protein
MSAHVITSPQPTSSSSSSSNVPPALRNAHAQALANQKDPNVLVIAASSESLKGVPNWDRIMKVVDCVNTRPETTETVVQALHKRMESKDHSIAIATLACIEALVKNAPTSRRYIGSEAFLYALVHTLPKQIRKPASRSIFRFDHTRDVFAMERYDRILVLIQSWGRAFDPTTNPSEECLHLHFHRYYKKMIDDGVKFAEPDIDEMAPVLTPPRNPTVAAHTPSTQSQATSSAVSTPSRNTSSSKKRPPLIYANIPKFDDKECQELWNQLQLLCEMIDASSSSNPEQLRGEEAATTLYQSLLQGVKRVRERLSQQNNDSTLSQLLLLEDACPLAMKYYLEVCEGKMMTRPEARANPNRSSSSANTPGRQGNIDEKSQEGVQRVPSPGAPEPRLTISEADQLRSYHNQYNRHSSNSALFPTQALPHPLFMRGPQ